MASNERKQVLHDAANLIVGDRNEDYGDPYEDFGMTADLWHEYLNRIIKRKGGLVVEPHDVAVMMVLLKVSRLSWTPAKRDHWVDIAGYVGCGWDCVTRDLADYPDDETNDDEIPV